MTHTTISRKLPHPNFILWVKIIILVSYLNQKNTTFDLLNPQQELNAYYLHFSQ
jgi:hypothetical protein